jgi:serine/threonine-protein kinase HipA
VVFNAVISNRDDHLRNHGFILMPTGWRLSPAFDINPNIDKAEHALNFDMGASRANLESIIATAQYYELTQDQAKQVANEILGVTRTWEAVAKNLAISRGDIELMRAAFHTSL